MEGSPVEVNKTTSGVESAEGGEARRAHNPRLRSEKRTSAGKLRLHPPKAESPAPATKHKRPLLGAFVFTEYPDRPCWPVESRQR